MTVDFTTVPAPQKRIRNTKDLIVPKTNSRFSRSNNYLFLTFILKSCTCYFPFTLSIGQTVAIMLLHFINCSKRRPKGRGRWMNLWLFKFGTLKFVSYWKLYFLFPLLRDLFCLFINYHCWYIYPYIMQLLNIPIKNINIP